MDNLSAHKVAGIRDLVQARGAHLLYLPPYSPDLNPIEQAWSKFKPFLRASKASSQEALDQAVTEGLQTITPDNAAAWFRHCGYLATASMESLYCPKVPIQTPSLACPSTPHSFSFLKKSGT